MTLFLLAFALSMDAFAVALSQGSVARPHPGVRAALGIGVAFGIAQAVMPLLGWVLGFAFAEVIRNVDHWIAFILLLVIGAGMVRSGFTSKPGTTSPNASLLRGWALLSAAIATSIDAAAAGLTLPLLGYPVLLACGTIGLVTLVLSSGGILIGSAIGARAGPRAEVFGGVVLIGIGTKILIDHLFFGG